MRYVLWMTGLSGAGKSTLAYELKKHIDNSIVLDGDVFRMYVSHDLGFSLEDRKENIRRAAGVADLLTLQGYFVIASFITPTNEIRQVAKSTLSDKYIECYVHATLEECVSRDPKGLYNKNPENMTGISSSFEVPAMMDLCVDTMEKDVQVCVAQILNYLKISKML